MKWPIMRIKWRNGCEQTVKRMYEEQKVKSLSEEKIKEINSKLEEMANANEKAGICREATELKDWQWEITLQNESEEDQD